MHLDVGRRTPKRTIRKIRTYKEDGDQTFRKIKRRPDSIRRRFTTRNQIFTVRDFYEEISRNAVKCVELALGPATQTPNSL